MTTLITGGTGNTGSTLARLLNEAGYPLLIASRKGQPPPGTSYPAVTFDWFNPNTFQAPFAAANDITRVYLVIPEDHNILDSVKPFIDLAISKGVKRFVLCAASSTTKGSLVFGEVYAYLDQVVPEYAVLKPTWFTDNFLNLLVYPIREYDQFASAAGDGRIPFIAAQDIAQAAFDKLTADKIENGDFYVLGPEFHTYDEAAEILSEVVGRKIVHKRLTEEESFGNFKRFLPEEIARHLAQAEIRTSKGSEEIRDRPNIITGKKTLREFITEHREAWIKK